MISTFYLHLEFIDKTGEWSINLPFLCSKCGVCCKLDDFLTAGEITAKPDEHLEVHSKLKALFEELGKMWEEDEEEYDNYIKRTSCPFLVNNVCSIYEIRPDGCRLFPNTAFGMLTQDCPALTRFKKQRITLEKGKKHFKETYFSVGIASESSKNDEPIALSKFSERQYETIIAKLRKVGITDDELDLLNYFNCMTKG